MDRSLKKEGREKNKKNKLFSEMVRLYRCDTDKKTSEYQRDGVRKTNVLYSHGDAGRYSQQCEELYFGGN